jgi:putative transcriptional regulator
MEVYVLSCGCKARFTKNGRRFDMKNRIEAIRKERGIRQEEFAKLMGVSRQTISSLETGRYNPSIFLAYKVAKLFGMTIEEVFIFEDAEQEESK